MKPEAQTTSSAPAIRRASQGLIQDPLMGLRWNRRGLRASGLVRQERGLKPQRLDGLAHVMDADHAGPVTGGGESQGD